MNCLFSGAITRIGGAQKCAGGVASVKYSMFRLGLFILGVSALFICPYPGLFFIPDTKPILYFSV